MFSCLSFSRVINYLMLKTSYGLSLLLRRPIVWGQPFAISTEIVRGCNLRCTNCVGGSIHGDSIQFMSPELFEKLIKEVHTKTFYLQLWFQGEPLLHGNLREILQISGKFKMFSVLATNGILLDEEKRKMIVEQKLKKIIITTDPLPASENGFRIGGQSEKVYENIRQLIRQKEELKSHYPLVEVQMIVTHDNEKLMSGFRYDMIKLGVEKVTFKSAHFDNLKDPDLPVPSVLARYKKAENGLWETIRPVRNRCRRLWSTVVVSNNGDIVPCCFDKKLQYILGNSSTENVRKIWYGNKFSDYRALILKNRKSTDICNNCTE